MYRSLAYGYYLTVSALALQGQVATAQTLNNLSASVSEAIDIQASMNNQLRGGLMIVNQRIDLVQEQVEILWQLAQLGCEVKLPGLCVTSIQYNNFTRAANLSKELSRLLQSDWSAEFDEIMRKLRLAIVQINSTRLDISVTQGLFTWISSAFSYFKEWVGVGMFGVTLFAGLLLCLWLQVQKTTTRKKCGYSPSYVGRGAGSISSSLAKHAQPLRRCQNW